ncbi:GUN4 domain-containing protein [Leptolyngbya ohadii]|uniref:GUN4 domain-containing protein n=1 Tax=Leptolyngbya ohadii TaxID=1962290 RepID=UPI000B598E75|nr:GUN4 domain-containing protein [Leptolyngbya ohadii]
MTSAQEQYHSIVRHYLQSGQISPAAQRILEQQRSYLNLLTDEAEAIEQSVLEGNFEAGDTIPSVEDIAPVHESSPAEAIPSVEDIAPVRESSPAEAIPSVEDISPEAENLETEDYPPEFQSNAVSQSPQSDNVLNFQTPPELGDLGGVPNLQTLPSFSLESKSLSSHSGNDITSSNFTTETNASSDSEARSRYKSAYFQAIRLLFPLDDLLTLGLRSLQQTLNLQDGDVKAIETFCQEEFEAEQQQYQTNLNLYREEFASAKFSLHRESVQDELWQLQRKLGLRSEDVLKLERDVMRENAIEADRDLLAINLHSSEMARGQAIEKELFDDTDTTDRFAQPPQADRSGQGSSPRPHTEPEKIVPQDAGDTANNLTDREVTDRHIASAAALDFSDNLGDWGEEQAGRQTTSINLDGSNRSANVTPSSSQAGSQVGSQSVSQTVLESVPQTELDFAFQELERHLSSESRDWWEADQTTYQILLKLSPNESLGWLDTTSIEQIYQSDALQRIDRLWSDASEGRFGLYAQREVYKKVEQELRVQYQDKMKDDRLQQLYIQEFVRTIGWWDNRLKFVKFYRWLSFELDLAGAPDIPQGQFPAYWFWVIPSRYALQLGGIGFGQGGWRVDTSRMRAWINKLRSCKFEP